ncbi:MAG: hypothetical protein RL065_2203, partial [Bacteroidota bacterium]
ITKSYEIEPDWSSIAFFYEIAALADEAEIIIENIFPKSIQGDFNIVNIGKQYGIESTFVKDSLILKKNHSAKINSMPEIFEFDFRSTPDLTQPIAAMSAGLGIHTFFKGIDHLALKETDRIKAMEYELFKINVEFTRNNEIHVLKNSDEPFKSNSIFFNTYKDHRMAMSLAPLCLKFGQIEIDDPVVVEKSFPNYWIELEKLGFKTNYK